MNEPKIAQALASTIEVAELFERTARIAQEEALKAYVIGWAEKSGVSALSALIREVVAQLDWSRVASVVRATLADRTHQRQMAALRAEKVKATEALIAEVGASIAPRTAPDAQGDVT